MSANDKMILTVYGCGALSTLLVMIWVWRKDWAAGKDEDTVFLSFLIAGLWFVAIPVGVVCGLAWLLFHSGRIVATGMIAVEKSGERRKERRELREKAQREIFADVDRMLAESNDDEIRAFMSKLTAERAA